MVRRNSESLAPSETQRCRKPIVNCRLVVTEGLVVSTGSSLRTQDPGLLKQQRQVRKLRLKRRRMDTKKYSENYERRHDIKPRKQTTRHFAIAVVVFKHRTLLGGVGIELASYSF